MKKTGNIQPDKLLWRVISDGADRFSETFDLAVAYLEGGSAYYVADHVNAKKKAAFVHIAYGNSGYTREMDRDCYEKMDQIFTVSQETRRHFLEFYPEYEKKVQVFTIFSIQTGLRVRRSCRAVFQIPIQEFES